MAAALARGSSEPRRALLCSEHSTVAVEEALHINHRRPLSYLAQARRTPRPSFTHTPTWLLLTPPTPPHAQTPAHHRRGGGALPVPRGRAYRGARGGGRVGAAAGARPAGWVCVGRSPVLRTLHAGSLQRGRSRCDGRGGPATCLMHAAPVSTPEYLIMSSYPAGARGGAAHLSLHLPHPHRLHLLDGARSALPAAWEARPAGWPGLARRAAAWEAHARRGSLHPCSLHTHSCPTTKVSPPRPINLPVSMQVRIRDFKPMLATQPRLRDLVKVRARAPHAWGVANHAWGRSIVYGVASLEVAQAPLSAAHCPLLTAHLL